MKKFLNIISGLLVIITVSGCSSNISNTTSQTSTPSKTTSSSTTTTSGISRDNYINFKSSKEGDYADAKALADMIDDVDDLNDLMGIEFDNNASLTSYKEKKKDKEDMIDITDLMFRATNANLSPNSIEELEFGFDTAKNCEKWCFDNHITVINDWQYWPNNSGQVRILYDKNKKSFTWEKSCVGVDEYQEAHNVGPDDEPYMEYRKYSSRLNNKNELEIDNIMVMYLENGDITDQMYDFSYVENEYFKSRSLTRYENYTVSEGRGPYTTRYFYVDTNACLKENKKYVERLKYDARYNENDEIVSKWVNYVSINYWKDYIMYNEWVQDDEWIFGYSRMYDYACNEIAVFEQINNEIRKVKLNLCCLKNIKLYQDPEDHSYHLYNKKDEEVEFDNTEYYLDIYEEEGNQMCYITFNSINDDIDEWLTEKELFTNGTQMMKKMCQTYDEFQKTINMDYFDSVYENKLLYDKAYRDESMKESDLPKFRNQSDVDCEVEGYVLLNDRTLDLSNVKVTIDKGNVFEEGTECFFDIYLSLDCINEKSVTRTKTYKFENGKMVIDDLGVFNIDTNELRNKNRTCLLMNNPDARIKLCDILLEIKDGHLVGKPVPIDYDIVDFKNHEQEEQIDEPEVDTEPSIIIKGYNPEKSYFFWVWGNKIEGHFEKAVEIDSESIGISLAKGNYYIIVEFEKGVELANVKWEYTIRQTYDLVYNGTPVTYELEEAPWIPFRG